MEDMAELSLYRMLADHYGLDNTFEHKIATMFLLIRLNIYQL